MQNGWMQGSLPTLRLNIFNRPWPLLLLLGSSTCLLRKPAFDTPTLYPLAFISFCATTHTCLWNFDCLSCWFAILCVLKGCRDGRKDGWKDGLQRTTRSEIVLFGWVSSWLFDRQFFVRMKGNESILSLYLYKVLFFVRKIRLKERESGKQESLH